LEGSTVVAPERRALAAKTMAEAFRLTVEQYGDRTAVRTKDDEISLTWGQLRDRVDGLAAGLAGLGVKRGDTVALAIGNRPEFHIADIAVMSLGATAFSVYATSTADQIAFVVGDAESRVAIIEEAFVERFLAARSQLPKLETIIVLEGARGDGTVAWDDVEGADADVDLEAAWRAIEPEDILTLIYTSGTTGPPKGVQITHRNMIFLVKSVADLFQFPEDGRVISWLPSAHIAERNAHHYVPILFGMTITSCPDPRQVAAYLPAVRPTWFFAVPRVWEKLKAGLEAHLSQDERKRAWLEASTQKVWAEQRGEPVPDDVAALAAEGEEQLFAQLRSMLGLDAAVAVNVGAAPTPPAVLAFFHAIGVPLAELWGMSETTGGGCCNPRERIKIGTVGPPTPGVEVKLGEDGELLVRAEFNMAGYRNQPERTAETIDPDGWLHTGDIAEIDEDNYVRIVDRKKELIISSAGKNMSPANIESTLKGASPLIGQACVIGDARPYNTALIVLDADFAPAWAAQHGLEGKDLAALAAEPAMREAVQQGIDAANEQLARVEQIKKFTLVQGDWLPGGDELTPTMKLKRKPIAEKYADVIESMYA